MLFAKLIIWVPWTLVIVFFLYKTVGPRRAHEYTFVQAGLWLTEQDIREPRRIMGDRKVAYYAKCYPIPMLAHQGGSRWVFRNNRFWPHDELSQLPSVSEETRSAVERYHAFNVGFMVLDERFVCHRRSPDFLTEIEMVGFKKVATFGNVPGDGTLEVWIYTLRPQ